MRCGAVVSRAGKTEDAPASSVEPPPWFACVPGEGACYDSVFDPTSEGGEFDCGAQSLLGVVLEKGEE